jgi:hypothetical protein
MVRAKSIDTTWNWVVRRSKHWLGDIQPFPINRTIDDKAYVLIDVVVTHRLSHQIAIDGRAKGVSVRIFPTTAKNAYAIYVWHNNTRSALDWVVDAIEPKIDIKQ